MVQALELHGDDRVLEVGTGLGVQSAILGRVVLGSRLDRMVRLVQPLGIGGNERFTAFEKRRNRLVESATLTGAQFVPLRGAFCIR